MVEVLEAIRGFLERNPGEIVILFDEDYVRGTTSTRPIATPASRRTWPRWIARVRCPRSASS